MEKSKEFRVFLEKIYGKHISDTLIEKNHLTLKMGEAEELYNGDLEKNKKQVLNLVDESYHNIIKNFAWAFDFPGWIGALDLSKENVKDILVIGMEPHVGDGARTAQITYGLRETENNKFLDLDNEWLLNNLKNVFTESSEYYPLEKFKNSSKSKELLNQIYITDMSPFAIKGKANQMYKNEIKKAWPNIRSKVAEKYITETIDFIKPKYIVSQGNAVGEFIDEVLIKIGKLKNKKEPNEFQEMGKYTKLPYFKFFEYKKTNIVHLRLPHLASGQTTDFWLPNIKSTKDNNIKRSELRNLKMIEIRKHLKKIQPH